MENKNTKVLVMDEMNPDIFYHVDVKKPKTVKKRNFLVSTEKGRVRGKISFYIAEIVPNKGLRLIDNDFTCSSSSNKGIATEAVQALVNKKELPINAIDKKHFINNEISNYNLIVVEGQGLNYINQY